MNWLALIVLIAVFGPLLYAAFQIGDSASRYHQGRNEQ